MKFPMFGAALCALLERRSELHSSAFDEAFDVSFTTKYSQRLLPLGKDVFRLETALRKEGAILRSLLSRRQPSRVDGLFRRTEIQTDLGHFGGSCALSQQHGT